jgi:hypothetical protein
VLCRVGSRLRELFFIPCSSAVCMFDPGVRCQASSFFMVGKV